MGLTTRGSGGNAAVTLLVAVAVTIGLAAGFWIAVRPFHVDRYKCGSVLSPKDPRSGTLTNNLAPLVAAHNECESKRSDRQRSALTLVLASAGLAIVALVLPPALRRERRARQRWRRARH